MITILTIAVIGYLLGSIPTGVWTGLAFKKIDIRQLGSKSIGATNVFRVLGAKLAIFVLIIDVAKGFFAAYVGSYIDLGDTLLSSNQLALIGGIAAIIGHLFPLFAGFKGGKGVATGAGMLLYLAPPEVGFAIVIFILTVWITRFVSLGSILATLFISLSLILEKYSFGYTMGDEMIALAIILMIIILYTHRANIGRLLNGKENRFGAKSS
jgi:glycerol-3-phosphate acyltransferase PlsY